MVIVRSSPSISAAGRAAPHLPLRLPARLSETDPRGLLLRVRSQVGRPHDMIESRWVVDFRVVLDVYVVPGWRL